MRGIKNKGLILLVIVSFAQHGYTDEIADLVKSKSIINNSANSEFIYYFHGEPLKNILEIFAKSNHFKISFARQDINTLQSPVLGKFLSNSKYGLLDTLSSRYSFEWFMYAGTIYITSVKVVNKSITVSSEEFSTIKSNLQQIGLFNPKFSYTEVPSENRIIVSGPVEYVNLIVQQVNNLKILPDKQRYVVYRLKYANAVDTQLSFNNQNITIPGIVTTLQNLSNGKINGGGIISTVNEMTHNSAPESSSSKNSSGTTQTIPSQSFQSGRNSPDNSSIQADPRTNSVIIIGDPTYVNMYKALIEKLDIPSILVQIDVLIVDLNQGKLDEKGINWSTVLGGTTVGYSGYGRSLGSMNQSYGNAATYNYTAPGTSKSVDYSGNSSYKINPGDIYISNLHHFDAEIRALEQTNVAQVTSKPSLVTENNLPAILSMVNQMYFPAQYGVMNYGQIQNGIQITPSIIFEKSSKQIRLSIVINDGAPGDDGVSNFNIAQTTLTSQVIVPEGQSVLLAGFSRDTKVKVVSKVPVLGDIPILGWLFKVSGNEIQNRTTLYLVTPKILWVPNVGVIDKKQLKVNNLDINSGSNDLSIKLLPESK